ncbi:hypothetical protein VTI28DRAFT_8877 [Corynascus sepedonium]
MHGPHRDASPGPRSGGALHYTRAALRPPWEPAAIIAISARPRRWTISPGDCVDSPSPGRDNYLDNGRRRERVTERVGGGARPDTGLMGLAAR